MSKFLLVDTNVWLDYFLGFRSGSKQAAGFVNAALAQGARLCHAVHATKDLFYLISADYKRAVARNKGAIDEHDAAAASEVAWACISKMGELSTAVGCDQSDVWVASKQRQLHNDYEDDLVIAAAIRCNADLLVTNDEKLLRHCPVASLSIEDAMKMLQAETA